MKVKAQAKGLKISPRKIGLVTGLVRRRSVEDSLVILEHTPKRGARILMEVLKSAVANAENNNKLDADRLIVDSILVGPGPILKRIRPAARGQAHRINYRTSNVTVILDELVSLKDPQVAKSTTTKVKAK